MTVNIARAGGTARGGSSAGRAAGTAPMRLSGRRAARREGSGARKDGITKGGRAEFLMRALRPTCAPAGYDPSPPASRPWLRVRTRSRNSLIVSARSANRSHIAAISVSAALSRGVLTYHRRSPGSAGVAVSV